ncbi:MAG: class I SAM-dependent methyltransferase [Erysipelotrichaceae bacterium]|nr:class I SAM-dependent methyltransferase [Erysipelotrichaceae bacterium]
MNNNTFVHKYLKPLIKKEDTVVDMTAGNGNDTLFLARLAKRVLAFDISEEAIRRSKEKTKDFSNIEFHLDSHANIDKYLKENEASLFIFNLGYLPNSEETITTKAEETLLAFQKAYGLLREKGYIAITFYFGQEGGYDEYYKVMDYIKEKRLPIMETYRQDKRNSPLALFVYKP